MKKQKQTSKEQIIVDSPVDKVIRAKVNKLIANMEFTNKFCETELKFLRQDLTRAMYEVARVQLIDSIQ